MRMILATTAGVFALAASLGGCATSSSESVYNNDLQQLEQECTARGGILTSTGQLTGRARTDNVCRITGNASRVPSGD